MAKRMCALLVLVCCVRVAGAATVWFVEDGVLTASVETDNEGHALHIPAEPSGDRVFVGWRQTLTENTQTIPDNLIDLANTAFTEDAVLYAVYATRTENIVEKEYTEDFRNGTWNDMVYTGSFATWTIVNGMKDKYINRIKLTSNNQSATLSSSMMRGVFKVSFTIQGSKANTSYQLWYKTTEEGTKWNYLVNTNFTISTTKTLETYEIPDGLKDLCFQILTHSGGKSLYVYSITFHTHETVLSYSDYSSWNGGKTVVAHDVEVGNDHNYAFSVTSVVRVSDVNYANPTAAAVAVYGKHYVIRRYDGAARANHGEDNENWVKMEPGELLLPGVGYIITAVPAYGSAIVRVPMAEAEVRIVSVYRHEGNNTEDAGWNMLSVPTADTCHVRGTRYVTVPTADFSAYTQTEAADMFLPPGTCFFIQVGMDSVVEFEPVDVAGGTPSQETSIDSPYTLSLTSATGVTDRLGLLIGEAYSQQYEIGADLAKMIGGGEQVMLYGLFGETKLAFEAIAADDLQDTVAIGYMVLDSGEYVIRLSSGYSQTRLYLVDRLMGVTAEMDSIGYIFTSEAGEFDHRFGVYSALPGVSTGVECGAVKVETEKILQDGYLLIIREGNKYNLLGDLVR